jgi:hypothetical protein
MGAGCAGTAPRAKPCSEAVEAASAGVSASSERAVLGCAAVASVLIPGCTSKATVPDTLDLADRARLALNGIGGSIDPESLMMYFLIHLSCPRPHLSHWASADTTCDPKFAESFPMMRIMCGSNLHADLEARFRDTVIP